MTLQHKRFFPEIMEEHKMLNECENNKIGRFGIVLIVSLIILPIITVVAISAGRYKIPIDQIFRIIFKGVSTDSDVSARIVIINLRLPRIIAAVLVGAALSVAGSTYQGLFRNPLVSPDVLGVSTGACIGAAIGILLGMTHIVVTVLAFLTGIIAMVLTVMFSRFIKNSSKVSMVLAGIIVSSLGSSVLGTIKYLADSETALAEITFWEMGSLAKITYSDLIVIAPMIIVLCIVLILMSWRINLYSLGDNEAKMLGANITYAKYFVILCATLLTATAVSVSGVIGWIGLTMPQLSKILVGENNTKAMPVGALIGMSFLIAADTIARTISPGEIPLAIITGFVGAPIFAIALIRRKNI